jgi:hypothetical protein
MSNPPRKSRLRRLAGLLLGPGQLPGDTPVMTLKQARASEFFRWFHLEEVGSEGGECDEPVRLFRPEAPKFRPLAAVALVLGERDRVVRVQLTLARSFIADLRDSNSARDLAKSFIAFAVSGADPPALKDLADEIQFRDLEGVLLVRSGPPRLPRTPSPAYRAFAGTLPQARVVLACVEITLRNVGNGRDGELVIAAAPIGS